MYVDFEYANRRLSDFDCIMCSINTDFGIREVDIGCDITFNTIKNNQSSLHRVTSSTYENVYETTFEIMKTPCGRDQDDLYMTLDEVRLITKWLNRREHHKFKMYNPDYSVESYIYFGSFNVKQIMLNGKVLGLSLTFTSNSPYGFAEKVDYKFETSSKNELFSFYAESDEIGAIYPTVSITFLENSDLFSIENLNTGTIVYIKNCIQGETITIDGENKIIVSDNYAHTSLYNDFNYEYLDVSIGFDGYTKNEYKVSSPSVVEINYMPIRKVGVY